MLKISQNKQIRICPCKSSTIFKVTLLNLPVFWSITTCWRACTLWRKTPSHSRADLSSKRKYFQMSFHNSASLLIGIVKQQGFIMIVMTWIIFLAMGSLSCSSRIFISLSFVNVSKRFLLNINTLFSFFQRITAKLFMLSAKKKSPPLWYAGANEALNLQNRLKGLTDEKTCS